MTGDQQEVPPEVAQLAATLVATFGPRVPDAALDAAVDEARLPARWYGPLRQRIVSEGAAIVAVEDHADTLADLEDEYLSRAANHFDESSLSLFMRDVKSHALLTSGELLALYEVIEAGRLASQALADETVPDETRPALTRRVVAGRRAEEQVLVSNLRLVVHIAYRHNHRGLPIEDLIEEGTLGLIRAVQKYDHRRGFQFSTYAFWWIRQAMGRALADKARCIRLPVHTVEKINRLRRLVTLMTSELGRRPTVSELGERVGLPPSDVATTLGYDTRTVSLDTPVPGSRALLGELLPNKDDGDEPEAAVERKMLVSAIESVLEELSEREQEVLRMRFGLVDGRTRTLEEVGREFGVTRERIRQIEAKALKKLKHPQRSQKLVEFLDYVPRPDAEQPEAREEDPS